MFVTEATIKTHINNAFAKIGACNRTEAAGYAERHHCRQSAARSSR
ncbi:LuxR C-terminal-related transcriptional regulator [Catenuloplanes nepalensis]